MTGIEKPGFVVGSEWLAAHLDDPDLRIYDCTVHLVPDPPRAYAAKSGREDYDAGHIPGAGFLDLMGALSDTASGLNFTMPPASQLEEALGAAGLGNHHRAVLYSTGHVMWASRVWWMLRSVGFAAASVLDGGLRTWQERGGAMCAEPCEYPAASFQARPRPALWADKAEVLQAIDAPAVCTINALAPEVHSGEAELNYGRKGHIKGSVNVPYATLLERGTFQPLEEITAAFEKVSAFDRERVIMYCGGGISATTDALALVMAGHPNVAVYDGSMSEWVRDPDLPMETG
ncbi:MAG: sulfurtransferase [Gammaproteobacteria bacterium]